MKEALRYVIHSFWKWAYVLPWGFTLIVTEQLVPFEDTETADAFLTSVALGGFAGMMVGLAVTYVLAGRPQGYQHAELAGKAMSIGCAVVSILFVMDVEIPFLAVFGVLSVCVILAALVGSFVKKRGAMAATKGHFGDTGAEKAPINTGGE